MYRGSNPRIFPLIIIIIVAALVIAAIVSIGRMVFVGNGSDTSQTNHQGIEAVVYDTADGRSVRWTVRGPIVANEKFESYQIIVSPTSRTYTIYKGYLDQVISEQHFDNNRQAYEQFVYALGKANIATKRSVADNDIRGVCATDGLAFVFETAKDGEVDNSEWTSSCPGSKGTMTAKPDQVQALFVNQVPGFTPRFNAIY